MASRGRQTTKRGTSPVTLYVMVAVWKSFSSIDKMYMYIFLFCQNKFTNSYGFNNFFKCLFTLLGIKEMGNLENFGIYLKLRPWLNCRVLHIISWCLVAWTREVPRFFWRIICWKSLWLCSDIHLRLETSWSECTAMEDTRAWWPLFPIFKY